MAPTRPESVIKVRVLSSEQAKITDKGTKLVDVPSYSLDIDPGELGEVFHGDWPVSAHASVKN